MSGVSVLILTLNEEADLPRCLASVEWSDDLVVLDSCSSDRTVDIANGVGARVVQRQFDNYASQRNYGLNEINYKYPWVLMVDADEVVPPELATEIEMAVENAPADLSLYHMRRADHLFGKWLKHSSGYPTWFGRLVRIGEVRVERTVNEEYVTSGTVGLLNHHLLHYPFSKGFSAWLNKHNRYSTMEAQLVVDGIQRDRRFRSLFSRDPVERRRALKSLLYRMPGRPFLVFLGLYVLRLGFLDGREGLRFCILRSIYEYMIDCKVKELKWNKRHFPI